MNGLSKEQNELLTRVDEVLHYLWDPIGVCNVPGARDEYSSYARHVFSMLIKDEPQEAISDYLRQTRVVRMGIGQLSEKLKEDKIAEILANWKAAIFDPTR